MTEPTEQQIATVEAIGQLAADLTNVLMTFNRRELSWDQAAFAMGLALKGLGEAVHQVEGRERPPIYAAMTQQIIRALKLPNEAVVMLPREPGDTDAQAEVIPVRRHGHH